MAGESGAGRSTASSATPELKINVQDPDALPSRVRGVSFALGVVIGLIGILLSLNQVFNVRFFGLLMMIDTAFYYMMMGLFLSLVFLIFPAHKRARDNIPIYDWVLFLLTLACCAWLAWNSNNIIQRGWDIDAPTDATIIAGIVCLLALEAVRRVGGMVLFSVCLFFFLYPLFAEYMPGFLWGPPAPPTEFVRQHAMGTESLIGIPLRVVTMTLIGFLIFGSALVVTGGGEFFMAFATALMGHTRGGPAKVSVVSSGLFGSLSGSVISNVVTTGQITIPTMKRTGYPASYAAAVEACASTGGALAPPVMGAVAFIMAEFLNVSYATIVIAAALPAALYYGALLFQIDNYAARNGLRGQPKSEIPNVWRVLRDGWYFLFSLIALIYMMLVMRLEEQAPYYATLILLITAILHPKNDFGLRTMPLLIMDATRNIANIVGLLAGIGLIVGALSYTGVGPAFSRELLLFAGGNLHLILIFGAITSFVLGMGMTSSACYIFLAIVMGPAIAGAGVNLIAGHLFILYWGLMSFITPPVAIAAITAASIARAPAMAAAFRACRLGLVLFALPFLFVYNPTLILHGTTGAILHDATTAIVAIWVLAAAFEGWLYGIGRVGMAPRVLLFFAAGGTLDPGWTSDAIGLTLIASAYALGYFGRDKEARKAAAEERKAAASTSSA